LIEIYSTSNPQLSNIVYENVGELESHSKRIRTSSNNIYKFQLTNEFKDIIGLNGVNMQLSLLFYEKFEFYGMLKNYITYSMMKEQSKNIETEKKE
jgi:hypothetical protein